MTEQPRPLAAICSWCPDAAEKTGAALQAGARVTHTICEPCSERVTAQADGVEQIAYTPRNAAAVIAWLQARNLYAECTKCGGSGEFKGPHGVQGCLACNSRLVAVRVLGGISYLDYGDLVAWDGHAVEIVRAQKVEDR